MLAFPMPRLLSPILEQKSLHAPGGSLPVAVHESQTCFVAPLFSWSYKLLFPQALCFDKHLRCPRVSPPNRPTLRYSHLQTNQAFPIHSVANFWPSPKKSCALESTTSELFPKTPGWRLQRGSKSASSQCDRQADTEHVDNDAYHHHLQRERKPCGC